MAQSAELILKNYQTEASDFFISKARVMLIGHIGSGKTLVALESIRTMLGGLLANKILIVAPPRVASGMYPAEFKKWSRYSGIKYALLQGDRKDKELQKNVSVYIVSYSLLEWFFENNRWKMQAIIMDESHFLKSEKTKRFEILSKHIGDFYYRLAMTGTPIGNGLQDVWSQYFLLDSGKRLLPKESQFLGYWFTPPYKGYRWVPKRGAKKEIVRRVSDITFEIKSSSVKLPKNKYESTIFLELPEELQRKYDQFAREQLLLIEQSQVPAFSAGSLLMKLRQFCCGFVYNKDLLTEKEEIVYIHDLKLKAVKERIKEIDGSVMFVANFREEFARLKKAFPGAGVLNGSTTARRLKENVEAWNSGKLKYLGIHPKTAGTGLNLQGGGYHQIWTSPDWSQLDRGQTTGRIYRQGQKSEEVFIDTIIFRDTIEETIMHAIAEKVNTMSGFLKLLQEEKKIKL